MGVAQADSAGPQSRRTSPIAKGRRDRIELKAAPDAAFTLSTGRKLKVAASTSRTGSRSPSFRTANAHLVDRPTTLDQAAAYPRFKQLDSKLELFNPRPQLHRFRLRSFGALSHA